MIYFFNFGRKCLRFFMHHDRRWIILNDFDDNDGSGGDNNDDNDI